jgi:hypothetical protein
MRRQILFTFVLIATLGTSKADELLMKNGSVIIGKLVSAEADSVIFETPFAGRITVTQENIQRISTKEPVTLMMEDGTIYRDRQIVSNEEAMLVKTKGERNVVFKSSDIEMVNPEPWKIGEGYDWTGRAMVEVEFERGNSNTDLWEFDLESIWRSLTDRYTFEFDLENEEKNESKTEENWNLLTKYDRFLGGLPGSPNYWGVKGEFEHDKFADLDLRTKVGPYLGRQFSETKRLSLRGEFGPVYVDETFNSSDNQDWWGASWIVKLESDITGFGTTLYINHDGTQNFEDADDLILNATIGIRFPLLYGFETAFEAEYEYDGGAVTGIDELDETYNWRLGYAW